MQQLTGGSLRLYSCTQIREIRRKAKGKRQNAEGGRRKAEGRRQKAKCSIFHKNVFQPWKGGITKHRVKPYEKNKARGGF
jgi:hypothetical protein